MQKKSIVRIEIAKLPELSANGHNATILVTRPLGEIVREAVLLLLDQSEDGLLLDFSGIEVMDSACADEIIAKPLVACIEGRHKDRVIAVANLAPGPKQEAQNTLEHRRGAILHHTSHAWEIMGSIHQKRRQVLEFVINGEATTSITTAQFFGMERPTASALLRRLYRLRLMSRLEQPRGLPHLYYCIGGKFGDRIEANLPIPA